MKEVGFMTYMENSQESIYKSKPYNRPTTGKTEMQPYNRPTTGTAGLLQGHNGNNSQIRGMCI
jgi:hypothetical protein